ncbi:myb_DNA-bind_5 domain-containing protein [Trichonephila clavipes]|nr:myb_DNA-bind_5 domain-containing protein [Trichonephila clavipes]
MAKKSSVLRQERRQTGGGEVPKEAELTDFEMRFLEEPILTLPLSTPFDSDSTDIEISKPQYPSTSTSALLIPPVTPSQNTEKSQNMIPRQILHFSLFWGLHYELIPGFCIYLNVYIHNAVMDMNDLKPTPKIARPLKETLAMFRKRAKTPTAPSAAARAAACIEEEHRMKIKYMEMDEERKMRSTSCGWSS